MLSTAAQDAQKLETLQQDIKFVNSLLSQCGLEAPFPFHAVAADVAKCSATEVYALESALQILIALLNSKQKETAFRSELEDRQRRLAEELDQREAVIGKFYTKLEGSEKDLRATQQELREMRARVKQLEGIAQNATEEASRVRSAFAIKEKHFGNEIRKREREFERLREQLQACLREPALTVSNARAENTFDVSAVRASLSAIVDESEGEEASDRVELLEHENANMRQLLVSLNQILGEMRNTAQPGAPPEEAPHDYAEQISSLPIAWVYEQVKGEIEASLAAISDRLRSD